MLVMFSYYQKTLGKLYKIFVISPSHLPIIFIWTYRSFKQVDV